MNINAPAAQTHHIDEDVHLVQRKRVHVHDGGVEFIDHRDHTPLEIDLDPTQVRVHASGHHVEYHHGLQPQQSRYRGELREAPRQQQPTAALPAPSARAPQPAARSLPAPREAALPLPAPQSAPAQSGKPMQIADQRGGRQSFFGAIFFPKERVR